MYNLPRELIPDQVSTFDLTCSTNTKSYPFVFSIAPSQMYKPNSGIKISDKKDKENALKRLALAAAFGRLEPIFNEIEIEHGCFDQPRLKGKYGATWGVSISHSELGAGVLIYDLYFKVGLDIEKVRKRNISRFEGEVAASEMDLASHSLQGGEDLCFTHLWASKEALSKALQTGLTASFSLFKVRSIRRRAPNCYQMLFELFPEYQALNAQMGDSIISIVLPFRSSLEITRKP